MDSEPLFPILELEVFVSYMGLWFYNFAVHVHGFTQNKGILRKVHGMPRYKLVVHSFTLWIRAWLPHGPGTKGPPVWRPFSDHIIGVRLGG
jgi:hypothetical protein